MSASVPLKFTSVGTVVLAAGWCANVSSEPPRRMPKVSQI
jgi:hypothetical protein